MPSLKPHLLAAVACGVLLILCALGVQTWRVSRLKEDVETARARELGAKVQARLSDKVRTITETLHTRETIVREVAHDEAAALRTDSAGTAVLDAGLLARWRGAVERVRAASEPATVDPGAGDAEGGMPSAGD